MNLLKKLLVLVILPACVPTFGMEIIHSPLLRRRTAALPLLETLNQTAAPGYQPIQVEKTVQSLEAPATQLPEPLRRRKKKKKLLRIEILKREAHKAEMNRRVSFKQDFINCLYEKYATTEAQKMPLRRILGLTEIQKDRKIAKLKTRNIQLYQKFCAHTQSIHSFMNEKEFTKASNTFRNMKIKSFVQCDPAIDEKSAAIYFLQHARTVIGAIVWATEETIDKYDINKENNETEIQ